MEDAIQQNIDTTIPRRKYYSHDVGLANCPECNSALIEEKCPIVLAAKSDTDEAEFITNFSGSCFCSDCPVVVFDSDKIEEAARLGIRGDNNLRYFIAGIVDTDAVPKEKRHLPLGIDGNPIILVKFLPNLALRKKKIGRNEPCPCKSGKKYKKCCGRLV